MYEGDRMTYYVPHREAVSLGRTMWVMGFVCGLVIGVAAAAFLFISVWPTMDGKILPCTDGKTAWPHLPVIACQ